MNKKNSPSACWLVKWYDDVSFFSGRNSDGLIKKRCGRVRVKRQRKICYKLYTEPCLYSLCSQKTRASGRNFINYSDMCSVKYFMWSTMVCVAVNGFFHLPQHLSERQRNDSATVSVLPYEFK